MSCLNFQRQIQLPVAAKTAFEWHLRPGAFQRLVPPWAPVRPIRMPAGLTDDCVAEFDVPIGPIHKRWVAHHRLDPTKFTFQDIQERGPFREWVHTHALNELAERSCVLTDAIEFKLPLGYAGYRVGKRWMLSELERMFGYRHRVTLADLSQHERYADRPRLRIAISGASGMVGSSLRALLSTGGHEVVSLVRRTPQQDDEVRWDPAADSQELVELEGVDAVVHLAGENIASRRWSRAQKQRILSSRVDGTRALVSRALARLQQPPQVFISGSAIGYYGDRADEELTEESPAGEGFLADVCRQWEAAAEPAATAGIRVVTVRLGVVLSPAGGALQKMLPAFRLGGGGPIGNGRQYLSWIALDDVIGALYDLIMKPSATGPVNLVAPQAVTNRQFAQVLGRVLRRPSILPLPAPVARVALGEMADELLLASARVRPGRLQENGYDYRFEELESALRHILGRAPSQA